MQPSSLINTKGCPTYRGTLQRRLGRLAELEPFIKDSADFPGAREIQMQLVMEKPAKYTAKRTGKD